MDIMVTYLCCENISNMKILDNLGRQVNCDFSSLAEGQLIFDIIKLSSGLYFIYFNDSNLYTSQFVKK